MTDSAPPSPPDAAIKAAGEAWAEAQLAMRRGTVAEAAARSYGVRSGRVTQTEMERRIQVIRDGDAAAEKPHRK